MKAADSVRAARQYYDGGGAKNAAAVNTILTTSAKEASLGRTLDIGCGNGAVLNALLLYTKEIFGIDNSEDAIELARERVPQARLTRADVQEELPFPDGFFDSVFMLDVIEHLRAPALALEETCRVLRTGGLLVVTTPNANSPVRYLRGKRWFGAADPGHLMLFTGFTLSHLLQASAFHVDRLSIEPFTNSWVDQIFRPLRIGGTLFAIATKAPPRR